MRKLKQTKRAISNRAYHQRVKAQMVEAYGGKCEGCGETDIAVLGIDHKNGDGAEARRKGETRGRNLYAQLRKLQWPKDRFRLLCLNCNWRAHVGAAFPGLKAGASNSAAANFSSPPGLSARELTKLRAELMGMTSASANSLRRLHRNTRRKNTGSPSESSART